MSVEVPPTPTAPPPAPVSEEPGPPGRSMLAPARARLAYRWNNSPEPAWRAARRAADSLPSRIPVTTSHTPSGELSIAYAGLPIGRTNVLQLLEHQRAQLGLPTAGHTTTTVQWKDLAAGSWPEADLVVIGAEEHRLRRLPERGSITAPFRLHLVVDIPPSQDRLSQQVSKRERWQFRRDHKEHQWTLEQDPSPAALDFFYRRMHTPTMARRHGERSRTESPEIARHAVLHDGTLFFLNQGGKRVAGVLCHWLKDHQTLTTRLLGVLDGQDEHYRTGAFKALYHLLLQWACDQHIPRVDFFGTEAFISKGIFQWKRKLAARPELPDNHFSTKRLRLYPRRDTPAVRDFLVANPLLRMDPAGSTFTPVYYTDDHRPPRLDLSARCPGLPDPEIVHLDAWLTTATAQNAETSGARR